MNPRGSPAATRLLVVGDSLLDIDLVGRVERISPDAPVPVVDQVAERARPGGAALAALLAAHDGHHVTLLTPLARDEPGDRIRRLLGGSVHLVDLPHHGVTPVKRRVRADGQSLIRIDVAGPPGRIGPLTEEAEEALETADALLVSDYGRGMTGVPYLRDRLQTLARRVPVVWDPHPRGMTPVPGVRLVTPNRDELRMFAQRHGTRDCGRDLAGMSDQAHALVVAWQVAAVAVTMADRGALLSYGRGVPVVVPAPTVSTGDPCGAGDRFAAAAAAALGCGAVTAEAVQHAVTAASGFVAAGGVSAVGDPPRSAQQQLDRLLARVRAAGGLVVATGGCFDLLHPGHVATLRSARRLGDCLVVCLNSDASVHRLKGPGRPVMPAADRARVLEALECVDAVVVFDEDTPIRALERIRPDVWAKGGDYAGAELPEAAVLSRWGGQAVVLPYVPGRSTTALAAELARAGVVTPVEEGG